MSQASQCLRDRNWEADIGILIQLKKVTPITSDVRCYISNIEDNQFRVEP